MMKPETRNRLILILLLLITCAAAFTFVVFEGYNYFKEKNFGWDGCKEIQLSTPEECKEVAHTLYGEDPVLYLIYENACESGCNCTHVKQDCGLLTEKSRIDCWC